MRVAVLAGQGTLPRAVVESCKQQQIPVVIVAFKGQTPKTISESNVPIFWNTFGKIGKTLNFLKEQNITHIVMAGGIKRPHFQDLEFDIVGLNWFSKLGLKAFLGDDALLSRLVSLLSDEGLQIIAPSIFVENLLMPHGVLTKLSPTDQDKKDIERGEAILNVLSPYDIGQAIIIYNGIVVGIEATEGTASLIDRSINLRDTKKGGVLIKLAKEGQSHLVDLPTIGPDTVQQVFKANLSGIAVSALTTQIIDKSHVIEMADKCGLFLIGV